MRVNQFSQIGVEKVSFASRMALNGVISTIHRNTIAGHLFSGTIENQVSEISCPAFNSHDYRFSGVLGHEGHMGHLFSAKRGNTVTGDGLERFKPVRLCGTISSYLAGILSILGTKVSEYF